MALDGCAADHVPPAVVAACTAECFLLADDLAYRPSGDLDFVIVAMMCAYARDVARGALPGPYDNADACRYARAVLVPEELLERPALDLDRAAAALGVPARELHAARDERQFPDEPHGGHWAR
jgi:hypothetical protein